jgi:hypothetical protein
MTKTKIKIDRILTNYLRANITDPNSSRSGNWIYPDFPRVQSLGDTSFPRVGITILSDSGDEMGINDETTWHTISIQMDVVTKKDLGMTITVTDEAMGTVSSGMNSDRLTYDYVPTSVTNIKHDGTGYGTVTNKGTNSLFTTPSGMAGDVIEWSTSTGDLNLNATDVTADDGEAITSTYTVYLEGKKLVEHVALDIIKYIRSNWRGMVGVQHLQLINHFAVPIDEEYGLFRQTIEYQVRMINVGEGL